MSEMLEREKYLNRLKQLFTGVKENSGHTAFITGEAGIGKTTLVNAFIKSQPSEIKVLTGACDSLLTPRPLGPLFDIAFELSTNFRELIASDQQTSLIFSSFLNEIRALKKPVILLFEDVHWADGGTLDFIKFLARRIHQLPCLFLLTYRNDEVLPHHPLRKIFIEIPATQYTHLPLQRLSISAVQELAEQTQYNAVEIYKLTEGNPFFVNEVLAAYNPGVPQNLKDSVLAVFHSQPEIVRILWETVSILPGRISTELLQKIEGSSAEGLAQGRITGVLKSEAGFVFFKHELYRKTIEEALSSIRRVELNTRILEVLLAQSPEDLDLSILLHVAQNARNKEVIATYAPAAAQMAASFGAHLEASKLYLVALECTPLKNRELAELFEKHVYECYLTNQIHVAIKSQEKALQLYQELGDKIRIGASYRFLSRLNWFIGNREIAEELGLKAIEFLENGFPLAERAKAYSNYSQLKMLSNESESAIKYGEKAVALAKKIDDDEILSHAMNNIGSALFQRDANNRTYLDLSLSIALKNNFHEHVARAYTNLSSIALEHKRYKIGEGYLEKGIAYCNDFDLVSWKYYMLAWKARLHLETGNWQSAKKIAANIEDYSGHPLVIRIEALEILGRLEARKGNFETAKTYLNEAIEIAAKTMELQRISPVCIASLEYGWISGDTEFYRSILALCLKLLQQNFRNVYYDDMVFWLYKNKMKPGFEEKVEEPCLSFLAGKWDEAAAKYQSNERIYEQALVLADSTTEENQKYAVQILQQLAALGTLERVKNELRSKGVKSIPRGTRSSTRSNSAQLTKRQVEVLKLLKEGLQNTEIAEKLFISAKTVDHHVSAILFKLDVNNRNKAVLKAEKLGIL